VLVLVLLVLMVITVVGRVRVYQDVIQIGSTAATRGARVGHRLRWELQHS
jgi:hypothetical protein